MTEIIAEAVRANLKKRYADGWKDGIRELAAQITGTSEVPGTVSYSGPVPDELRVWLEGLLERMEVLL